MAYKQSNNPFKKLHGDLQGFGEKHAAWKAKREEMPQKKYGYGSEGAKAYRAGKKAGESKFQYDIRMRKEGRKASGTKPDSTFMPPDPKHEMNIEGAATPSWEYKTQERNPGDLRQQSHETITTLPSAPGDEWEYTLDQDNGDTPVLWGKDPDGDWHEVEPGSDSDKAIRERYTGSETGDLSSWYGHDTSEYTASYNVDPVTGEIIWGSDSYTDVHRQSYLPYDLAQKHHNPGYKGSKKK